MAAAFALTITLAGQAAAAPCLPLLCKFSVSGKPGVYLTKQVNPDKLVAADAVAAKGIAGRSLAEQSISRGEFAGTGLDMPATRKALEEMVVNLRKAWPAQYRQPPEVTIRLIGSTDYNPSARPDNVIVVPLGVLIRARSDDEVAWVIAHEFSHIALGHFSREAENRGLRSFVSKVAMSMQTAADFSQQRVDTTGQRMRVYTIRDPDAERFSYRAWAYSRDVGTALELVNQHVSRKQEDQADAAGLDLVLASAYADTGPGDALDAVEEDEKRLAATLVTFQQQMGTFTKQAGSRGLQKVLQGADFQKAANEFFEDFKRNVIRMLIDKALDMAKTSHRPAAFRRRGVSEYMDTAYRSFDPPRKRTAWLDAVRSTKEYDEARRAVEARDAALVRLSASDGTPQQAWAALQPALGTRYAPTPLIANTTAKIYDAMGDTANADRTYTGAENPSLRTGAPAAPVARPKKGGGKGKSAPAAPATPALPTDILFSQSLEGFRDHVRLLVRIKNYSKALATIQEAKRRFEDDDPFLPSLVTIYVQTRKSDLLVAALSRCMETEDENLRKQCQYAMFNDEQLKVVDQLSPADRDKVEVAMAKTSDASRRSSWLQNAMTQATTKED
jgi:Zn-dependent protease with chaperone function